MAHHPSEDSNTSSNEHFSDILDRARLSRRNLIRGGVGLLAASSLPVLAAVTYVLSTGDPVGGTAVKVKLAGLFGLKDFYALVAIPVTRGLKQAERRQIEAMLGPIARAWIGHKFEKVREMFEQTITGDLLAASERAAGEAERLLAEIDQRLTGIAEGR